MPSKFEEITTHIEHARTMMNEAEAYDEVNPKKANQILKKIVVELLQALEKLCTVEVPS